METAPLKSFATWARTALISEVTARIAAALAPGSSERIEQARAITALEKAITDAGGDDKGRDAVADKVAYTWFNRIVALRFMDANGYTGIGVVSPQAGVEFGQPEILAEAKRGVIDSEVVSQTTRMTVTGLLDATRSSGDPQGEAYALLLADYCRHWNRAMPFMFEREGDFTELLIPANLLADDSVLNRSVKVLTEEICKDVETVGWLYQFYISERKEEVYEAFKKVKADRDEIAPATQIFTPHWIVRYLVENSLGRLWMLNRPSSGLTRKMDFYVAPADEETDFLKITKPEDLKVIDPACGSGHMLTYAFDLLYAIYEEEGFAPTDIPSLILANNLFGTEIDSRAGALAAFALTMKARSKQRTFFDKQVEPHVRVIESISFDPEELDLLVTPGGDHPDEINFWNQFRDADVLGALVRCSSPLRTSLASHLTQLDHRGDIYRADTLERAGRVVAQATALSDRYDVVVANPPYLGTRHMGARLRDLASANFPVTKGDLCTMFLERSLDLLKPGGLAALVTSESWFFNTTFEATRTLLARRSALRSAVCIDSLAFGVRLNTVASVLELDGKPGGALFTRVGADTIRAGAPRSIPVDGEPVHLLPLEIFKRIPGGVYAFDMPEQLLALYESGRILGDVIDTKQGMATTDNGRFVRFWYEVDPADVGRDHHRGAPGNPGWVPYNKGGTPVRWWGNQEHVVRWKDDGRELIEIGAKSIKQARFFETSISWSNIGKGGALFRLYPPGYVFDVAGMSAFAPDEHVRLNLLGYLNADVVREGLDVLAPTLNYQVGDVARLPVPDLRAGEDDHRVRRMIALARTNWAERETSREFATSPLLAASGETLADKVATYVAAKAERRAELTRLERESSKYWSSVLTSATNLAPLPSLGASAPSLAVPDANEVIEDLVSFAVGCMMGRYSIDGFAPDADNVIPVVDGDWFEDDIVARFRQFLRVAFGPQHFEENLRVVTESLGVKTLRDYLVKSFYKDHWQRYRKRPIYWLFSSPKGSFNALINIHRYTPSTVSTVLNEYLREFQAKLQASLENADRSSNAKEADRLRKVLIELSEYEREVMYPLAAQQIELDLDAGVRANYSRMRPALAKIPGLEKED
jgi:hypothetical protein